MKVKVYTLGVDEFEVSDSEAAAIAEALEGESAGSGIGDILDGYICAGETPHHLAVFDVGDYTYSVPICASSLQQIADFSRQLAEDLEGSEEA